MRSASSAAKRWSMSALRLQELRTVTHEASVQPQTGQNRMKSSARIVVDVVVRLQTPGGSAPRATNPNRARLSGLGWQSPVLRLACRTDAQRPSWRPLSVADDAADVEETELTPEGDIESWSALPPAAALPSLASLGRRRRPRAGSAGGHEGATSGLDGETECGDGDDGVAAGLQQGAGFQPRRVLGLDVEYAHFRGGDVHAAEVCLVEAGGEVVFHSFCNPGGFMDMKETLWSGGVPPEDWRGAPSLKQVVKLLLRETWDCILVGHGLRKDLDKLNIRHPKNLQKDTTSYAKFQGRGGQALSLGRLAKEWLGRTIQSGRHSAREDAQAALDLYLEHVLTDTQLMDEEEAMQHYLEAILAHTPSRVT